MKEYVWIWVMVVIMCLLGVGSMYGSLPAKKSILLPRDIEIVNSRDKETISPASGVSISGTAVFVPSNQWDEIPYDHCQLVLVEDGNSYLIKKSTTMTYAMAIEPPANHGSLGHGQIEGNFLVLHYPLDMSSFFKGVFLCAVGVLSGAVAYIGIEVAKELSRRGKKALAN